MCLSQFCLSNFHYSNVNKRYGFRCHRCHLLTICSDFDGDIDSDDKKILFPFLLVCQKIIIYCKTKLHVEPMGNLQMQDNLASGWKQCTGNNANLPREQTQILNNANLPREQTQILNNANLPREQTQILKMIHTQLYFSSSLDQNLWKHDNTGWICYLACDSGVLPLKFNMCHVSAYQKLF